MSHPESPKPIETEASEAANLNRAIEPKSSVTHKRNPLLDRPWLPIVGILLLLVGAGWGWNWWANSRASNNAAPSGAVAGQAQAVPVKLAAVELDSVEDSSQLVGTLESRRSVALKPELDGRISQILVSEGDRVRQGQVLVRLDSDDVEAELFQAKAELENAKAALAEVEAGSRSEEIAEAKASLQQAQARLSNAKAGARPEEIAQAEAQVEAAKAEAELARQRVDRYRNLQQEGAISTDQFQEYVTEERLSTAALQEAEKRLSQARKSRSSDIDELAAAVEQEKQTLRRLENGARPEEIAQAKARVAQAAAAVRIVEVTVQKTKILAPFSGKIGAIPAKVGDYVSQGDELTTITESDFLELNLSVPIDRYGDLRQGLPVEILDSQGKTLGRGKISFISPKAASNSQLVLAKAVFENSNGQLLDSQLVQAKVIWDTNPGILVPATAVSRLGGQTFVFVAQTPSSPDAETTELVANQRQVTLGALQGNSYQVLEGLKAGEKIVTAGILNLRDGAPIQPLEQ